jgi:hypothetical protein
MTSQPTNPGQQNISSSSQTTQQAQPANAAQKISEQLPKTWYFGISGERGLSQKTIPPIQEDFKQPLKRVGLTFVGLFAIIFLVTAVYKFFIKNFPSHSTAAAPSANVPVEQADACSGMTAKMQTAKVSSRQVDKIFWQKHPDKLNKPIGNDPALRQEWCQTAGELVGTR